MQIGVRDLDVTPLSRSLNQMMSLHSSSFSFLSAHIFVAKFIIDSITYSGDVPNAQPSHSPIRASSLVTAATTSLIRNLNAQLATIIVLTSPGSVMEFY